MIFYHEICLVQQDQYSTFIKNKTKLINRTQSRQCFFTFSVPPGTGLLAPIVHRSRSGVRGVRRRGVLLGPKDRCRSGVGVRGVSVRWRGVPMDGERPRPDGRASSYKQQSAQRQLSSSCSCLTVCWAGSPKQLDTCMSQRI